MTKCYGCGKGFASGAEVVEWSVVRALIGEKSGALGFYPHASNPENGKDYIHADASCLDAAFSPMTGNNFMWDILAEQARQQIYEEEKEYHEIDFPKISVTYLLEDPPYCLWCKREDTIWGHFSKGYPIWNCLVCRKLWDGEEDELVWDEEQGDYFIYEVD